MQRLDGGDLAVALLSRFCHLISLDVNTVARYHSLTMIRSWRDRDTERVFDRRRSQRLAHDVQRVALRKLLLLDAAGAPQDLRIPPGNRLERLSGDREGQYSIRINNQWRICFKWQDGDAYDVEIVDYH